MRSVYFMNIPVYRVTKDRYNTERDKYMIKIICGSDISKNEMSESEEDIYNKHKPFLRYQYGGEWEFNEIVGFIKLHFLGKQIRGEYFTTKPRRKVKTRRKIFIYNTHKLASEISLDHDATNSEIYTKILAYIERCRKELPRRYIDDKYLKSIGPFVDWNKLILGRYQN